MKKFIVYLMMALVLLGTTTLPVIAQDTATQKPNMFPSRDAATTALQSGNFTTYQPQYFGLRGKDPVNGTTKVAAPLEGDAVVYMLTTASWQWVVQPRGTMLRWNVNQDGTLQPYALDSCGNPAKEVYYPPPPEAPKPTPPPPPVETWQKQMHQLQPPTVTLSADKEKISKGEPVTLTWNSTNADYCTVSWAKTQAVSGATSVTLEKTTSFVVTAYGADGKTATATVTVAVKGHKLRNGLLIAGGVILGFVLLKNAGGHGGSAGHSFGHTGGVR